MTERLTDIVDIIPARATHVHWILSTFLEQISMLPLTSRAAARAQTDAVARILRSGIGSAISAVPRGFDDDLLGWSLGLEGAVLYVYVRDHLRRGGIGSQLMTAATDRAPIPVAYWTPEAEAMEAHGFPVHYDIHAFRALCSYVRRDLPRYQHHTERAA